MWSRPPTTATPPSEPTAEQAAVIEAPAERRLVVLAGPGTGKTFTLVARVGKLAAAGESPLVLSFTRAVVGEMHRRLRDSGTDAARYVRPVTFDSFATRLLGAVPALMGFRDWEHAGYEGRIAAVDEALDEVLETREWVTSRFSHLVVDEVQDLTGRRGLLVRALCRLVPSFSLFGDPAQGIYGWQDEADRYSADDFLTDIEREFPDAATYHLTFNHRATTQERRDVADLRGSLLTRATAAAEYDRLRRVAGDAEPLGAIENAAQLLPLLPGRTAVLCRTNVEALLVSEQLFLAGIDHTLRRAATDRAAAPWIAQVARGRRGALSMSAFERLYDEASLRDGLPTDDAWDLLASASGSDDRVALDRVADALRSGRLPDELNVADDDSVVVSTIHRAKGLEFDNVVLVRSEEWRDAVDVAEEARVLYVALTRARTRVGYVNPLRTFGWRQDRRIDRWYRCPPREAWKTLGLEITGADAHSLHPAGSHLVSGDVLEIQERLETTVRRGDDISLRLVHADESEEPMAFYAIEHPRGLVGLTGSGFGRDLGRRIHAKPEQQTRWPLRFSGLRVEGIDTVAGLPALGADHGLGATGLWLRIRVVGLGIVEWFGETEAT